MATKVKFSKSLNDLLNKRAGKLARKAIANPKLANRIKNRLLLSIKKEGIMPSGKPVKPLSDSWIERRGKLSTTNRTSAFYKKAFSNITFTGKFLKSFKATIIEKVSRLGKTSVIFTAFPTGDHKSYKPLTKKRGAKSSSITNEELGKHLIKSGRDYTVISGENRKKIAKSMKSAILKEFKLNLKRK